MRSASTVPWSACQTAQDTLVNGSRGQRSGKAGACKCGEMAAFMRAIGKIIRLLSWVASSTKMATSTRVSGKMTKQTALDTTSTRMDNSTEASGKMTPSTVRGRSAGQMARNSKESSSKEGRRDRDSSSGLMETPTMAISQITISTGKVSHIVALSTFPNSFYSNRCISVG